MSVSEVHEEEIGELQKMLAERREAGVKGAYPAKMRERIVRLWRNGVPMKVLTKRLGIAKSMLYAWRKNGSNCTPSRETAADVLQVMPQAVAPEDAVTGELRLQMGMFTITVSLAGA